MTPERIEQLEQMLERGTIRKGHIAEMLEAIKKPAREWVGLTDEDIGRCFDDADGSMGSLIAAIEAKLREKNGGAA